MIFFSLEIELVEWTGNLTVKKKVMTRISHEVFFLFQLDLEEVWSSVEPSSLDNMKSVYRLIHDAGEMGICYFNLKVRH